jgi:hypothetical protein
MSVFADGLFVRRWAVRTGVLGVALVASPLALGCSSGASGEPSDGGVAEAETGDSGGEILPFDAGAAPPADAGVGHVVFRHPDGAWRRVAGAPGAPVENIGAALDAIAAGQDNAASLSLDGRFVALDTGRLACSRGDCLGVAAGDLRSLALVSAGGTPLPPAGRPSISAGGGRVVYPKSNGDRVDLYSVAHAGSGWAAEVPLTTASRYPFHHDIAFAWDGSKVVFDCGPSQYQAPGTCICEARTDGSALRKVLCPEDSQGGSTDNELHHPAYAPDGTIVFEADWHSNETVWRMNADGTSVTKVSPAAYSDDNSPCVLLDGRIVSLWLGRKESDGASNSIHELKVMNADGTGAKMLVTGIDIVDVGLSCGL